MIISKNSDGVEISLPFRAHWFGNVVIGLILTYLLVMVVIDVLPVESWVELSVVIIVTIIAFFYFNLLWFRMFGFEKLRLSASGVTYSRAGFYPFGRVYVHKSLEIGIVKFEGSGLENLFSRSDVMRGTINGKLVLVKGNSEVVRFGNSLTDADCNIIISEFAKMYDSCSL